MIYHRILIVPLLRMEPLQDAFNASDMVGRGAPVTGIMNCHLAVHGQHLPSMEPKMQAVVATELRFTLAILQVQAPISIPLIALRGSVIVQLQQLQKELLQPGGVHLQHLAKIKNLLL